MSFRPAAPPLSDRIRWPADFGRRFTIFVDTEEEFDWAAPLSRDSRSVTAAAAIPAAARRFADLGAPLTYLVDHPIATDRSAIDPIARALEDGVSSVGTQLHPWVNPPHDEAVGPRNSFPGNLPPALEAAKLDTLHAAIGAAFGITPRIYRAGRYGLGPNTLSLLAQRGYRIDSSMRAGYDYRGDGGPDFSTIGNHPFRTGLGDLVELPLTTVYTGLLRRGGARLHRGARAVPHGLGALARLGLLNRISLTPEGMPIDEAMAAVRVAADDGLPLLVFSFHSPTLVAGHTPYARDAAGVAAFWRWWDRMLGLLAQLDIRAASAADLLAAVERG